MLLAKSSVMKKWPASSSSSAGSVWLKALLVAATIFVGTDVANGEKVECGIPNEGGENRIVAGTKVKPGRYPWLCLLRSDVGNCGSAIISATKIMTAAHCVVDPGTGIKVETIGAFCGCWKQSQFDNNLDCGQKRTITGKNIIPHPKYSPENNHHDIAVLVFNNEPMTLGAKVRPLCLPPKNFDATGLKATIAGWGASLPDGTRATNDLMETNLTIAADSWCRNVKLIKEIWNSDAMICTKNNVSTDCSGDSGGSLFYRKNAFSPYFAVGLVSFGPTPCVQFSVYVKLTNYLDFVLHNKVSP